MNKILLLTLLLIGCAPIPVVPYQPIPVAPTPYYYPYNNYYYPPVYYNRFGITYGKYWKHSQIFIRF